jgi:hypothetical protein
MFLVLLKVSTSDVSPVNRDIFLVLLKVSTSDIFPVNGYVLSSIEGPVYWGNT